FPCLPGAAIDLAHHNNLAQKALLEGIALDQAVKTAIDLTSDVDTLTMVTADHSHVFNIAGYPARGHSILGKEMCTLHHNPLIHLGEEKGARYQYVWNREQLLDADDTALNFKFPVAVPIAYETHGGEDVAIYAQGPMSHLVSGNWEQHFIAHVMAYAACVGPDKSHCTETGRKNSDFCQGAPGRAGAGGRDMRIAVLNLVVVFVCSLL
ncbi:hypothetical protein EGW08_019543, partial [Elysia chlorotica]